MDTQPRNPIPLETLDNKPDYNQAVDVRTLLKRKRRISLVCLYLCLLAIVFQCLHQSYNLNLGKDQALQIASAENWKKGHGLSVPVADVHELSQTVWEKLLGWPPGYPLMYLIARPLASGPWQAAYLLDALSIVIFFTSWFFILNGFHSALSAWAKVAIWGYWALIYSPLMDCSSSELLSMAFFSAGLALLFKFPKNFLFVIAAGILLGLSASVRYAFWPLLAVPALYLSWEFWQERDPRKIQLLVSYLGSAGLVLILVILYQNITTGESTFLSSFSTGMENSFEAEYNKIQWGNLQTLRPFSAAAFGFQHGIYKLLQLFGIPTFLSTPFTWVFSALTLAVGLLYMAQKFSASAGERIWKPFLILAFSTGFLTLAMLLYLALKYPALKSGTFLTDLRYYAPLFPFLLVILFAAALPGRSPVVPSESKWLRITALALILLATAATGLWRLKKWNLLFFHTPLDLSRHQKEDVFIVNSLIDRITHSGGKAVILDTYGLNTGAVYLQGARVLYGNETVLNSVRANSTITLLVPVSNKKGFETPNAFMDFILRSQGKLLGKSSRFEFYGVVMGSKDIDSISKPIVR